jgi:hypothetical protein
MGFNMMTTDPAESRMILQNALEALKRGDRVTAQRLAEQAAAMAPETEAPWLILAALAGPAESLEYARKALQINPDSQPARQAWDWALRRLPAQPPQEKIEQPPEAVPPVEAGQPAEEIQPVEGEQPAEPAQPVEVEQPAAEEIQAVQVEQLAEEVRSPAGPASPAEPPAPRVAQRKKNRLSPALIILIIVVGLLVVAVVARFTFLQP